MNSIRLQKATWWSVTAYGDNISRLESKDGAPAVIDKIYGGVEICPTSGRRHYQGAIKCHTQCRGGVILNWIPGAHIEKARKPVALKQYAMKEETAEGEKDVWENPEEYLTMDKALEKLARNVPLEPPNDINSLKKLIEWEYWEGVKKIIMDHPSEIGLYSQPQMYRAWTHTRSVWKERGKSIVLRPANEGTQSGNELFSPGEEQGDEENLYD